MLSSNENEQNIVYLNGLNKCVTVRDSALAHKDVRLLGCEDSYVYIDTCVDYLVVNNCLNCTIMVASVEKAASIDKCENCTITVASSFLRIGNCVDCTVYSFT